MIRFCSDLSDYRPFGLLTLRTIDPSDYWPFGLMNWHDHERRGVLDITLCHNVCRWFATDRWFSAITTVSSTNQTDSHDITEILLKVVFNTIAISLYFFMRRKFKQWWASILPPTMGKQIVIKFTSCLPMVGGSLRLLPPLKLVVMI